MTSFKLRSQPNKKSVSVESYEEAQALKVLCQERFGREIEIEGEVPSEFDTAAFYRYKSMHWRVRFMNSSAQSRRDHYSVDLLILGHDLANFESVDYKTLLQPYIDSNQKLMEQFKAGNDKALNSLMGKFLKDHKGHDAKFIKDALISMLS
jgi:hypothetical protein